MAQSIGYTTTINSSGSSRVATIQVMSGGAPKEVLAVLTPEFERNTGHMVNFTYIVISAMQERLSAGENPDMVLMPVPAIQARVKDGLFRGDAWAALGVVSVGMIVRDGAAVPSIGTLDEFRQTMTAAKSIVHANPGATPSGAHFSKVWERLGMTGALTPKLMFRNALDGGVTAIATGEAEVGLYPLSEVIHEKGVRVVGLIPADVQLNTNYGAAVLSANTAPEPAKAFVTFLADPANAKHWKDGGFTPAS
jgi:molybdate transport system substrate-binding protein